MRRIFYAPVRLCDSSAQRRNREREGEGKSDFIVPKTLFRSRILFGFVAFYSKERQEDREYGERKNRYGLFRNLSSATNILVAGFSA